MQNRMQKNYQVGDSSQNTDADAFKCGLAEKISRCVGRCSLYEKKKLKKKDEETGEEIEVEDYDWDAITKAVKTFVDDYNSVVEQAGNQKRRMCCAMRHG